MFHFISKVSILCEPGDVQEVARLLGSKDVRVNCLDEVLYGWGLGSLVVENSGKVTCVVCVISQC